MEKTSEIKEFYQLIGAFLQAKRLESGTKDTQKTIADIIGCSKSHIYQLENGYTVINAYELSVYCKRYKINANEILKGTDTISDSKTIIDMMQHIVEEYQNKLNP